MRYDATCPVCGKRFYAEGIMTLQRKVRHHMINNHVPFGEYKLFAMVEFQDGEAKKVEIPPVWAKKIFSGNRRLLRKAIKLPWKKIHKIWAWDIKPRPKNWPQMSWW